jgi:ketosteroid isomerase-like protein
MREETRIATTSEVIDEFSKAFNGHDVPAIMDLMPKDCVFENTSPFPDGERYEGQAAVRKFWEDFFRSSPQAVFQSEDQIVSDDRCVVRWTYHWGSDGEQPAHIRGVDVFRVRDGKVAEKLSYVKG